MKHVWLAVGLLVAGGAEAQVAVDYATVARIRSEALERSQVMQTLRHLTEDIGPRLTNSPGKTRADAWTQSKLREWGLANVHAEPVADLARGWEFSRARVEMLAPRAMPLHALPRAWTPGTDGPVEGEAIAAKLDGKADLDKWRGKLRGKIVFLNEARAYKPNEKSDFHRHDDKSLEELVAYPLPKDRKPEDSRDADIKRFRERLEFAPLLNRFLADEGVAATVTISSWDDGIVRVTGGGSRKAGEAVGVPALVMMAEHYNAVMRALDAKRPVRMRVDVDSRFLGDANDTGYNILGEIPGNGPNRDEIVMIGAHLDSWHAGSGASDNGAGVAVMMEAMRILKAVGAKPRRTIRVALWTGEEQGLLGSAEHVKRHFARYPDPADPAQKALPLALRDDKGKLQRLPGYEKLSVYFNLDNGSGRIRGVYAQDNLAAAPIFEAWLKPFHDLGARTVTQRNTGSTDHVSFDQVGLPGFQFVQDGLDYFSHVHHTHLDVEDHASADDLKQASAIVAAFAYNAAMAKERFPRKPLKE